jgi:outer membrane protein TolC
MRTFRSFASSLLALAPLLAHAQQAPQARLSQDEVVARALAQNGILRASRSRRASADAQALSARGRLLPSVKVSDELQRWDSPFSLPLAGTPLQVSVRDQTTNEFTVAAAQPILGLLHIASDVDALGNATRAAEADAKTAEAAIKEAALTQLLQLFEARALGDIARASVEQLTEQLHAARARLREGVITRADVLRIETAAANAQQLVIKATAEEDSGRALLLVTIGEPPDLESIDFTQPLLPEPAAAPELGTALSIARSRRPELKSAHFTKLAAQTNARARAFDLLPEVNAEVAYLHVTGQTFFPRDSSFVGLKLEWPVWEWGARWYARSAAGALAEAAAAQEMDARDRVSAEVAARLASTHAAAGAVAVARTAIASAEEAYWVTLVQVQEGAATTTDLLDAQAALTTARSNLARAQYAYARTEVNLARAEGTL